MTPRLLDLFCCQGGAARGYAEAGFEVVGVDMAPQPRYPYEFVQADALDVLSDRAFLDTFDAVHASPPCQRYTQAQRLQRRQHPDLVEPTRAALDAWGGLWVLENVPGAPMRNPVMLCGTEFGLPVVLCRDGVRRQVQRHRLFDSSIPLRRAGECRHTFPAISVFGDGGAKQNPKPGAAYEGLITERRAAMGIDWTTRAGLSEAIPPAFALHLGLQLMAALTPAVVA